MRKLFTAVLLMSVSGLVVSAPKEGAGGGGATTGYLGQTNSSYDGDTNMAGLYAACQADYGDGALVCNTKDLFESPSIAGETIPASGMWVRPFVLGVTGDDTSSQFGIDYTGTISTNFKNCAIANGANDGNIVTPYWQFSTNGLCSTARPAACCR